MDTLHMLTEPIRKANARRLQEETNGLIKEFIYHEGKTAHFVLEVKGSNGGQMCTL